MSSRTKARKRALDVLFSADVRGISVSEALEAEAVRAVSEPERTASWLYAREILDGFIDHRSEIDEIIETYARGWSLERMPAVDRAIVRIAVWEILYNPDVPSAVAVDEAVEAAKSLSTDESSSFVNGLLATIASTAS
jgi:N utilization substance protein B